MITQGEVSRIAVTVSLSVAGRDLPADPAGRFNLAIPLDQGPSGGNAGRVILRQTRSRFQAFSNNKADAVIVQFEADQGN